MNDDDRRNMELYGPCEYCGKPRRPEVRARVLTLVCTDCGREHA